MSSHSREANGNISPSVAVKLDTSADGKVVACAASETTVPYGISGPGTRNTPYSSLDDGYHAIAGENCQIFATPGERCLAWIIGTVTRGDALTPSTLGKLIATTTDKVPYIARALASGVSGDLIEVEIEKGFFAA